MPLHLSWHLFTTTQSLQWKALIDEHLYSWTTTLPSRHYPQKEIPGSVTYSYSLWLYVTLCPTKHLCKIITTFITSWSPFLWLLWVKHFLICCRWCHCSVGAQILANCHIRKRLWWVFAFVTHLSYLTYSSNTKKEEISLIVAQSFDGCNVLIKPLTMQKWHMENTFWQVFVTITHWS